MKDSQKSKKQLKMQSLHKEREKKYCSLISKDTLKFLQKLCCDDVRKAELKYNHQKINLNSIRLFFYISVLMLLLFEFNFLNYCFYCFVFRNIFKVIARIFFTGDEKDFFFQKKRKVSNKFFFDRQTELRKLTAI